MEKKNQYSITYIKGRRENPYRCRIQVAGKRNYFYFPTKVAAELFLSNEKKKQIKKYQRGDRLIHSLGSLYKEWREEKSLEVSESTLIKFDSAISNFRNLNKKWFNSITREECLDELKNKDINKRTVYNAFYILEQMNDLSKDKYQIGLNWSPGRIKKRIKINKGVRKKPREFHKREEIKKISECFKNPKSFGINIKNNLWYYHIYLFGVNTGLRIGEIFSLKKKNYFKHESKILVNSTLVKVMRNNQVVYGDGSTTKTKTSRYLNLNKQAREAVEYFLSLNLNSEFLISPLGVKPKRDFVLPNKARDILCRVCKHLDVPYIGTHGAFRKTFATQISISSKKSFKDKVESIQHHLGHKSPQMTMHYIQAIDTSLDDELESLGNIFE